MKKTKKYKMYINALDTLETSVELSKKEYEQQMALLRGQVAQSKKSCDEIFVAEEEDFVNESDTVIKYLTRITLGGYTIELIRYECKPGHYFK